MKWNFDAKKLDEIYKYPWNYLKAELKREGYKTDDLSMIKYFKYVTSLSKALWNSSIDKLLGCGSFGGHKDTFIKNLNKSTRDLVYAWDLGAFGQRDVQGNIILSKSRLDDIIFYIADKLSKTEEGEEPNLDDFEENMQLGMTIIAHELMHALAEFEAYDAKENEKFECIISCFEFICFNFSNFPDYCEEDRNCRMLPQPCKEQIKCKKNPPPKDTRSSRTGSKTISYIPDFPDDHYSFSDFVAFPDNEINSNSVGNFLGDTINDYINFSFYPDILIYNKYGTSLMGNLLDKVMPGNYIDDYTHDYFSTNHKILVIPSSALIGDSQSEIVKQAITRFLESGRSVVLFSQQFGNDIKRLIPMSEDEIGTIIGFREDSSCLKNSAYFTEMHPILSSTTSGILDVGIDGYATVASNSNATVLLRRKVNGEPALLYYKYGAGTIYLFFGFTDYAYSRSMASTQEIKLVKNMLRHAMAPDVYIPIFDLEENPNPSIGLNIQVFNHSQTPAAKAKISVYTIENTPVYETEVSVNLNQGESAETPISFTLPDLESKDYGIGFTVYELKDASGDLIQLKTETPSGRFSIYKLITPANINGGLYQWITVNDEIAYWGQDIECNMHFKNTTDQVKQVEINNPYFTIGHGSKIINFSSFSASVNPGETYEHTVSLSTTEFSQWDNSKITFRMMYYDSEGNYRQFGAGKVIYVKKALTQSTVELNTPYALAPGGSLDYSLHSFSEAAIAGESTVKLALEKYTRENSTYVEIKTLYQGTHDFSTNGDFQYTDTYTPETVHPSGSYRVKLEVTAPNGVKELTRYQDFFYERSGFKVTPRSIEPGRWLVPGESYTIPVYVTNVSSNNDYHVTNGRCVLRMLSPGSQEIYRKEITDIDITQGSQLNLTETFVFNPVETGDYTLEYAYEDETFSNILRFRTAQVLYYWPSFSVTPDKPGYDYMDTANITVKINGLGSYTIQCQCPEAGVAETRIVAIPAGQFTQTEVFQVPIGLQSSYTVNVEVKDAADKTFTRTARLAVNPIEFDYSGNFNDTIARAGFHLEFEVNIKRISGFSQPLTGELAVTFSQLNYQDIKP